MEQEVNTINNESKITFMDEYSKMIIIDNNYVGIAYPQYKKDILMLNITSTIKNSSFLYTVPTIDDFNEIIEHENLYVANLPIFKFSGETIGFSSEYERIKIVSQIKKYLDEDKIVIIYTISDKEYQDNNFEYRIIVINKDLLIRKDLNYSKYMLDILNALDSGERNETIDLMIGLSKLKPQGSNEYKKINNDFFNQGWEFKEKYDDLTEEEKINNKIKFNGLHDENNNENNIDELLDATSQFTDNNNPYPILNFVETFNSEDIKYKTDIRLRYEEIINNPVIQKIISVYEKWNTYVFKFNENKYIYANYFESVDKLLDVYEIQNLVNIDKTNCFKTLRDLLNESKINLNVFNFVDKYYTATKKYDIHHDDFIKLFVDQYLRSLGIRVEIKLF